MKKFKEVQRYTQWWLWLILIGFTIFISYLIYRQYSRDEMFGDYSNYYTGLILLGLFVLALILFFSFFKMTTKINEDGVFLEYFPFTKLSFGWDEIADASIVSYGKEKYGNHKNTEYGNMYNTKDAYGLYLILKDGEKYCIGTKHKEEIEETIEYYFAKE